MAKRRYGSGTVFQEDDHRWTAQWELPKLDGKRRRRQLRADTEAAAWKRMREAQRAPSSSSRPSTASGTVGAFLERWLRDVVARTRRERTVVGYRAIIARLPAEVASRDLADGALSHELQAWLHGLQLHPRTVRHYAACLRAAFGYATRKGMIARNPAADLDLPAVPRADRIPLTAAQLRAFLDFTGGKGGRSDAGGDAEVAGNQRGGVPAPAQVSASDRGVLEGSVRAPATGPVRVGVRDLRDDPSPQATDRLHALWVTAAWTGMRQGEMLALRWQDVNLDGASLVVRGSLARLPGPKGTRYIITEPKTDRSRRFVPLVPEVVEVLRAVRKAQLERPGKLDQGLVFCTEAGSPLDAANVSRWFGAALRRAGMPAVRFHDLRHTAATLMIEKGIDLPTVSKILGHSNIGTTVDLYGHVTDAHAREAMARLVG